MSLAQYQALLARLWTDAALRERFAHDPRELGREYRLSPAEIDALLSLPLPDIQYFANSLHNKRRQEVGHFLPLTQLTLGERYSTLFARYAAGHPPLGPNGLRIDAIGFARQLAKELEPPLNELARYEAAWPRMAQERRGALVQRFAYPVHRLCRALERGGGIASEQPAPHLGLWWRMRRDYPIRHRMVRLASRSSRIS